MIDEIYAAARRKEMVGNFVRESNRIEGITRDPTHDELTASFDMIYRNTITAWDLCRFVSACQPGAILRDRVGLDVSVGNYHPPDGGPRIPKLLDALLGDRLSSPHSIHCEYESLHPFTDCNGRSGRALWAHQMIQKDVRPGITLGFLHAFYYQTLDEMGDD